MKLILLENVNGLGQKDEVVDVKPGYGRHYLLPKKLAKVATDTEVAKVEKKQAERKASEEAATAKKKNLANTLSGKIFEFQKRIGAKGKIFGSVTAKEIAEELVEKTKIKVREKDVVLEKPIKEEGEHKVIVRLGKDVEATIKVIITGEGAKK